MSITPAFADRVDSISHHRTQDPLIREGVHTMGLSPSSCLEEDCYGNYDRKPSKKLVPLTPASHLNSPFGRANQSVPLEEVVFADFSDPFTAKFASQLGDFCSNTSMNNLKSIDPINVDLQPSIESKGKYIEDSTSDQDFPVNQSSNQAIESTEDISIDLGTFDNELENAVIDTDRLQLHPLLIQSPTSRYALCSPKIVYRAIIQRDVYEYSRRGLFRESFFEPVSYDPMVEAANALQQAIDHRKYDEVQSLQRDLHIPVAHIKLEVIDEE